VEAYEVCLAIDSDLEKEATWMAILLALQLCQVVLFFIWRSSLSSYEQTYASFWSAEVARAADRRAISKASIKVSTPSYYGAFDRISTSLSYLPSQQDTVSNSSHSQKSSPKVGKLRMQNLAATGLKSCNPRSTKTPTELLNNTSGTI